MTSRYFLFICIVMFVMGVSVASQAGTIAVGSATGAQCTEINIPITIDDTAGRLDFSFSVSFDNTKLQYTGKTSGDMGATLITNTTADINAAGKVLSIVTFEDGGATSGTICNFLFNIISSTTGSISLLIGDIAPSGTFIGVNGTVTITPAIGCCIYISPISQNFTSSGGTGNISVTTSSSICNWTTTSNDSWITITSGTSGTGSGTVNYSVSANTTTSQRTGTMTIAGETIAGETFIVTQQGLTCTYTISSTSQSFSSSGGTGSVSVNNPEWM